MRHRFFAATALLVVSSAAWLACVGADPVPAAPGGADAGIDAAEDRSVPPDARDDAALDAADAGLDAAPDACAIPPVGAGYACTASQTCTAASPVCCISAGVRTCVGSETSCGISTSMRCAARAHCAGAQICCLVTKPMNTVPNGTCPAVVPGQATSCEDDTGSGTCSNGFVRLCQPGETCPGGKTCVQLRIDLADTAAVTTGACL